MKTALAAGLLLALGSVCAAAQNVSHLDASQSDVPPGAAQPDASQEDTAPADVPKIMQPPQLSYAQVDWPAAVASLAEVDVLGPAVRANRMRSSGTRSYPALARLNAVMSAHFPALTTSPVPVLLPFDIAARLRDQAEGNVAEDESRISRASTPRNFSILAPRAMTQPSRSAQATFRSLPTPKSPSRSWC